MAVLWLVCTNGVHTMLQTVGVGQDCTRHHADAALVAVAYRKDHAHAGGWRYIRSSAWPESRTLAVSCLKTHTAAVQEQTQH